MSDFKDSFARKLHDRECPHNIYIQNYSSAASSCLAMRKFCFDVEKEKQLCEKDKLFRSICKFGNEGHIFNFTVL